MTDHRQEALNRLEQLGGANTEPSELGYIQVLGFAAVTQAILATASGPSAIADVDVLGHTIPVAAWTEFVVKPHGQGFGIWSNTLAKMIEPGDGQRALSIFEAIETRDQLIRMYASDRWKEM